MMERMNVLMLVKEFYAIEAIVAILSENLGERFESMRHSHSRWYRDFTAFRDAFIKQFAAAIFDYTALVVAGELRHCSSRAAYCISDFYTEEVGRNEVYRDCVVNDPRSILQAGVILFDANRVSWKCGYGGDKWRQIARAGLMKGTVNDSVFIDHCVDLSHNGCNYFNKGAGIFRLDYEGIYRSFLDMKRVCSPERLLCERLGSKLNQLLNRANTLGIISVRAVDKTVNPMYDELESALLNYLPLIWGNEPLDYSDSNIEDSDDYFNDTRREYDSERGRTRVHDSKQLPMAA